MTSRNPTAASAFRELHRHGLLVLANAWDAGTARLIESLGGKAIATSSAAVAWAHGYPDGDLLPLFVPGVLLSVLLFPPFTVSVGVAAAFQSYIAEEWIHHATHFCNFRDPYFRYMKKHHLYHHTAHGMTRGFGTSSGILDFVFMTRYPTNVRRRLYGGRKSYPAKQEIEHVS